MEVTLVGGPNSGRIAEVSSICHCCGKRVQGGGEIKCDDGSRYALSPDLHYGFYIHPVDEEPPSEDDPPDYP